MTALDTTGYALMIIDELIAKLSTTSVDDDSIGDYINKVADVYRGGADLRTLIPLLRHSDSRFVSIGAWIASQVVDKHRGRELFDELSLLLDHPDPAVRFGVIESVALLVIPENHCVIHRLFSLASDPNPGVRRHALSYLCWIPDSIVEALRDTDAWSSARLLLSNASKDAIRSAIRSERLFDQRMAVAAVLRNYGKDELFIQELLPYFDEEVTKKLSTLPRNRRFSS